MRRHMNLTLAVLAFVCCGFAYLAVKPIGAQDNQTDGSLNPKLAGEQKPDEVKKTPVQLFMRKKLEAQQKVMEGLAIEDYDLIAAGAQQLRGISTAADFAVVKDSLFTQHADEFRRIVDRIEKNAKEKRLDGATLGYMDLTMNCVECHRFVRNILVADESSKRPN